MTESSGELLYHRWLRHAQERPTAEAVIHWSIASESYRWTWGELVKRAWRYALDLKEDGVRPGQVCALIVRHRHEFYPLYLAVSLRGAIPAVLAYPNARIHPDKFCQGLEGMARISGLDWILTEAKFQPTLQYLTHLTGTTIRGLLCPLDKETVSHCSEDASQALTPPPVASDSPCLLQHSSGTTGLQKGVMLSHRAVLEHVDRYSRALGCTEKDRVVSWLPLYHDMGFIAAFHQSLALGIPLVQLDPFEWAIAPHLLLDAIWKEKGTLVWLPNFAFNFMTDRVHPDDIQEVRLDALRLLINCSEPIRAESLEMFRRRFEPYGLKPWALATCYAMAESTFAVTQTPLGGTPKKVLAERAELARGRFKPAGSTAVTDVRWCVSSGTPIDGCQVRVVGEEGRDLLEGHVGELLILSVSLFDGYRNQPEMTQEAFLDGWYRSGDLGFLLDGEVFVIGRKKDIIIVAGKNLYPEDIEDAVGALPGVFAGRVVAFGVENTESGTDEIHVIAETDVVGEARQNTLRQAIQKAGIDVDVTISKVILVPPRWLIKSTSGKISRSANKQRVGTLRNSA
jgi:acyl-CoA synthetase (AMP-forming)/AMP-acid ligase II